MNELDTLIEISLRHKATDVHLCDMITMEDSIRELLARGIITEEEAKKKAYRNLGL